MSEKEAAQRNPAPPTAKSVFAEAIAFTGPERERFLQQACGEEAALRAEVEELLKIHDAGGQFLKSPTDPDLRAALAEAPVKPGAEPTTQLDSSDMAPGEADRLVGTRIASYKLLELLGEGGFGAVYVAEQERPVRRRVALKLIKLGMDTRRVVARFEAERQALAMMDHPNIARVLDAGATESGHPWFAMELVRGLPITTFCDQAQLSAARRLELFVPVCLAVQHAHQKGIIHRDIKPSNVLVTLHDGKPVPKVIDFGIAKAVGVQLTDMTVYTQHRQMLGTPAYMSPEQAEMSGLDVDTRADVYSLGVVLYELLTGSPPFRPEELLKAGWAEMQRIIREVEPVKPSTRVNTLGETLPSVAARRQVEPRKLGLLLRGDLDWIAMKCLEKDRTRRYSTASDLAADVQRHLGGEPVLAAPPTVGYRVRKFVRRNRAAVVSGGSVLATLLLGIILTSWFAVDASQRRDEAMAAWKSADFQRGRAEEALQVSEAERAEKEQALERVGREAYATAVSVAATAIRNNQYEKARERLATCAESERRLEWRFLDAWARSVEWAVPGGSPALSSDGAMLAVSRDSQAIDIWDMRTRRKVNSFAAVGEPVFMSDNQEILALGSPLSIWRLEDAEARLWGSFRADGWKAVDRQRRHLLNIPRRGAPALIDVTTGRLLYYLDQHTRGASAACFSPSGELVATGGMDNAVCIWDVSGATHRPPLLGHTAPVVKLGFCYNNKRLCSFAQDHTLRLWNVDSQELVSVIAGETYFINQLVVDGSGDSLFASCDDGQVRHWSAVDGCELPPVGVWNDLQSIQLVSNKLVIQDGGRYLIDASSTPAQLKSLGSLDALTQGTKLAIVSDARQSFVLRLSNPVFQMTSFWLVDTPKSSLMSSFDFNRVEHRISWSIPSFESWRDVAITKSPSGLVSLISLATGDLVRRFENSTDICNIEVSSRGDRLLLDVDVSRNRLQAPQVAAAPREASLYRADGTMIRHLEAGQLRPAEPAFSKDGQLIATISAGREIHLCDSVNGALRAVLRQPSESMQYDLEKIVFNQSGSAVWAGNQQGIGPIWSIITREVLARSAPPGAPSEDRAFVRFSRGGDRLIASSPEQPEIVEIATGARVALRGRNLQDIEDAEFSGDGRYLLTYSASGTYRFWNAHTGEEMWAEEATQCSELLSAANILVDPSSHYAAAELVEGKIAIIELATGRKLETLEVLGKRLTLNLLSSGQGVNGQVACWLAASDGEGAVYFCKIDGDMIIEAGRWEGIGASANADSICISDDHRQLAVYWGNLGKLIDIQTGAITPLEAANTSGCEFVSDGSVLVSYDYSAAWDVPSGRQLPLDLSKSGLEGKIKSRKFNESLTRVFVQTFDDAAYLLDVADGSIVRELWPAPQRKTVAAVSRDLNKMISADQVSCRAMVWDVREGAAAADLRGHDGAVRAIALSADGVRAVTGGSDALAILWDVASATPIRRLARADDSVGAGRPASIGAVAISPDGGRIAAGADDGSLTLWNAGGELISTARSHESAVQEIQFTSDGRAVFSRSSEAVCILAADTGQARGALRHRGTVTVMSLSADGASVATLGSDQVARFWRVEDGQEQWALELGGRAEFIALDADGGRALIGLASGVCELYHVGERRRLAEFRLHEAGIVAASFTKDGSRIVTASRDRTIRIWNPERPDDELLTLSDESQPYRYLWLSPGETRLLAVTEAGEARVWDWSGEPPPAPPMDNPPASR